MLLASETTMTVPVAKSKAWIFVPLSIWSPPLASSLKNLNPPRRNGSAGGSYVRMGNPYRTQECDVNICP